MDAARLLISVDRFQSRSRAHAIRHVVIEAPLMMTTPLLCSRNQFVRCRRRLPGPSFCRSYPVATKSPTLPDMGRQAGGALRSRISAAFRETAECECCPRPLKGWLTRAYKSRVH